MGSSDRAGARRPTVAVPVPDLAEHAPEGLALIDAEGRIVRLNPGGEDVLGRPASDLLGTLAPFDGEPAAHADEASHERTVTWSTVDDSRRELAYTTRSVPGAGGFRVVAFRDITRWRGRQRRLAAIGRGAADFNAVGSLPAMLDSLAEEMLQTDALAGVQIMISDDRRRGLHLMGSAGFSRLPDFFERLRDCQALGAHLYMFDAIEKAAPVIVNHRGGTYRADPAWEPMREYLAELNWDSFGSFPLIVRGVTVGVLNAFFEPANEVEEDTLEFIAAMADQAAVAVDYADLLQRERETARRDERQRIARDLHDSVVQQVFSIRMQAQAMNASAAGRTVLPTGAVRAFAAELESLSHTALADLRALVHQLSPVLDAAGGLREAIEALVQSTTNRTGLRFRMFLDTDLDEVDLELADDLYRIIAEAVHNVVKHAEAAVVTLRVSIEEDALTATVSDNGRGIAATRPDDAPGLGLRSMQERARRWDGHVTVRPRPRRGTDVRVVLTLPARHPFITAGSPA